MPAKKTVDAAKLDMVVAEARRQAELRAQDYRARALKILPWVCGRCARTFTCENLQQLTVHHKDHNHHHNPPDGSNWELLCVYCHENEHARHLDATPLSRDRETVASHRPFAELKTLLKQHE